MHFVTVDPGYSISRDAFRYRGDTHLWSGATLRIFILLIGRLTLWRFPRMSVHIVWPWIATTKLYTSCNQYWSWITLLKLWRTFGKWKQHWLFSICQESHLSCLKNKRKIVHLSSFTIDYKWWQSLVICLQFEISPTKLLSISNISVD